MRLITKADLMAGVAARWFAQYEHEIRAEMARSTTDWRSKMNTHRALVALPPTATEDDVAAIIGNRSWTYIKCDECDREVNAAVEVGEEPDYESATACLCRECAAKALALFPEAPCP